jgi:hypothetical protein
VVVFPNQFRFDFVLLVLLISDTFAHPFVSVLPVMGLESSWLLSGAVSTTTAIFMVVVGGSTAIASLFWQLRFTTMVVRIW